jgi:hypothetical protein
VNTELATKADTTTVNAELSDKLSMSSGGTVNGPTTFKSSYEGATGLQDLNGSGQGSVAVASKDSDQQSVAAIEFLNTGRGSAYLGLDWDFTLKFGGGALGGVAYRLFHQGNLNPIQSVRLAIAGDLDGPTIEGDSNNQSGNTNPMEIVEPFQGAVVTGLAGNPNAYNCLTSARWRYLQVQDQNGNWVTVSYV